MQKRRSPFRFIVYCAVLDCIGLDCITCGALGLATVSSPLPFQVCPVSREDLDSGSSRAAEGSGGALGAVAKSRLPCVAGAELGTKTEGGGQRARLIKVDPITCMMVVVLSDDGVAIVGALGQHGQTDLAVL